MVSLLFIAALADPAVAADQVKSMRDAMEPIPVDGKDAVRKNCVAEKSKQAEGLLRIAEEALVSLQEAVARKDKEVAAHEAHKIAIAAQKTKQLRVDARQCVGERTQNSGDTQVIVKFTGKDQPDPTVMTILELLAPPMLLRPFQVSPYQ